MKCIRAEENKVPKQRFLFTRTHIDVRNQQNIDPLLATPRKSPLSQSPLNVEFNLNSPNLTPTDTMGSKQQLPTHLRGIVKALSINHKTLTQKMRSREIVSQLSLDFMMNATTSAAADSSDSINVSLATKEPEVIQIVAPRIETCSTITQTEPYECGACVVRDKRVLVNKHTQIFSSQKVGSTQTDEDDYRSPLIEMLSRLTDAQLVAIKDFIAIMMTRPQSGKDLYDLRERMMDIYNLSQRDAEAVRVAQRNRLDDPVVINQKRFRSCDSFGDSGSSRDREFDNSPHGRRSNGSENFNQNERYADSEERQLRLRNEERQRAQEQKELERIRYEEEIVRRRQADEEAAHEREKQRIRVLEEQEYLMRNQREEEEAIERRRQQQLMNAQQQQQDQMFGFGNSRSNRDDGPPFQPKFHNANRNARGAFRNDRGSSRGGSRGGRGRKF